MNENQYSKLAFILEHYGREEQIKAIGALKIDFGYTEDYTIELKSYLDSEIRKGNINKAFIWLVE